jgi:hypothetical protein
MFVDARKVVYTDCLLKQIASMDQAGHSVHTASSVEVGFQSRWCSFLLLHVYMLVLFFISTNFS